MNFVIDFPHRGVLCGSVVERIGARNPKESALSRSREDEKRYLSQLTNCSLVVCQQNTDLILDV